MTTQDEKGWTVELWEAWWSRVEGSGKARCHYRGGTAMIRRFIAWLFGMPLVALRDFDGQEVLRLGRKTYFGDLYAHRMPFKIRPVWLCPGGVIKPDCYVREWTMVRDYRRDSGSRAERHDREDGHGPKDGRAADAVGIAQNPEPKQ